MRREINIRAGDIKARAWLNETATAAKIQAILPVTTAVNLWGEEVYFEIPVKEELESPKETVNLGDIAYWPPGKALCIFFGKTPASKGKEIRPVSPVTVVGGIEGGPTLFRQLLDRLKSGESITILTGT